MSPYNKYHGGYSFFGSEVFGSDSGPHSQLKQKISGRLIDRARVQVELSKNPNDVEWQTMLENDEAQLFKVLQAVPLKIIFDYFVGRTQTFLNGIKFCRVLSLERVEGDDGRSLSSNGHCFYLLRDMRVPKVAFLLTVGLGEWCYQDKINPGVSFYIGIDGHPKFATPFYSIIAKDHHIYHDQMIGEFCRFRGVTHLVTWITGSPNTGSIVVIDPSDIILYPTSFSANIFFQQFVAGIKT